VTADRRPATFRLHRVTDVSGVSGTGHIADGVLWPDGTATVRWRSDHPSTTNWDRGMVSVEHVNGHEGATRVVWDNPFLIPPDLRRVQAAVEDCMQGDAEGWDAPVMREALWTAFKHLQPLMSEVAALRARLAEATNG
jgi:hypothetical protein